MARRGRPPRNPAINPELHTPVGVSYTPDPSDSDFVSSVDVSFVGEPEDDEPEVPSPSPSENGDGTEPDLAVFTGELIRSRFRIEQPNPERHYQWVSARALEKGLYLDWPVYTPEQYEEDKRQHGTRIPNARSVDGEVRVLLHHLRWVPQALWDKALARKEARDIAMRQRLQANDASVKHVQRRGDAQKVLVDVRANPLA